MKAEGLTTIVAMKTMIHLTRTAQPMKVRRRRRRRTVMMMLISVSAFLLMLISENRSSSAISREVNQAA